MIVTLSGCCSSRTARERAGVVLAQVVAGTLIDVERHDLAVDLGFDQGGPPGDDHVV